MSYSIQPRTPAGKQLIALASDLIGNFSARADAADRAGEIRPENFRDMQRT